jgi:hypothetical protein
MSDATRGTYVSVWATTTMTAMATTTAQDTRTWALWPPLVDELLMFVLLRNDLK